MARTGNGWFDVEKDGRVIGFVTGPREGRGNWECYLELPGRTSKPLGQAPNKEAAMQEVSKTWDRLT